MAFLAYSLLCALILSRVKGTTLLRGGTFITYSTETSDLEIINNGAMLFNDSILAISQTTEGLDSHLHDPGVQVVNTTGKIISPGFIDTHRHTWETLFRTLGPNVQLAEYSWLFGANGPAALILAPDDIYVSTLMGNLDGLNAGVTTTIDFAHMTWSRAHANASLQGNIDSGARIWWAYAVNLVTTSANPFTLNISAETDQLAHIVELSKENPFNNGLVTLSVAYDSFLATDPMSKTVIETVRNNSLGLITAHDLGSVLGSGNIITQVNNIPVTPSALNSTFPMVFVHCITLEPTEARLLRQFNQFVSTTPESEMHYGHTHPHSFLIQDQGSLGTDTSFTFSTDIITQMRIWLQSTRLMLYQQEVDEFFIPSDTPMSVKQAFLMGTRNGGLALRRPDLGVLNVGAKADVLVFSTDAIGLVGWSDPVAAIVLHSNVRDIEQVYVDGKIVKSDGKLLFDWQGMGLGEKLQASTNKYKEGLQKINIPQFAEDLKHAVGWPDEDFQVPFQVDVTRGNGTGF